MILCKLPQNIVEILLKCDKLLFIFFNKTSKQVPQRYFLTCFLLKENVYVIKSSGLSFFHLFSRNLPALNIFYTVHKIPNFIQFLPLCICGICFLGMRTTFQLKKIGSYSFSQRKRRVELYPFHSFPCHC